MISDLDIWRAANLLIQKHGANAELEAAKRADLMLDCDDDDGLVVWARIRRAAIDAQRQAEAMALKLGWQCGIGVRPPVVVLPVARALPACRGGLKS
jgi:hypothetical protein